MWRVEQSQEKSPATEQHYTDINSAKLPARSSFEGTSTRCRATTRTETNLEVYNLIAKSATFAQPETLLELVGGWVGGGGGGRSTTLS